jgi:cytochrome b561
VAFIIITTAFAIANTQFSDSLGSSTHGIIGLIVYILLCLQVGIGISRSVLIKPKAAKNPVEKFFKRIKQEVIKTHFWLGTLLWILAVVNIFLGIGLAGK